MTFYWRIAKRLVAAGVASLLLLYAVLYWAFSSGESSWRQGAAAPGKRMMSVAEIAEGKLFVFVGFANATLQASNATYVYDPELDTWALRKSAPLALSHSAVAADGSTIWMAGGFVGQAAQVPTSRVFWYESETDTWGVAPSLPVAIGGGGLVRSNRNLHYVGGFTERQGASAVDSHWILDLDEPLEWKAAAPIDVARGHAGVVALGQAIYVIGGATRHGVPGTTTRRVSVYDAKKDLWTTAASLPFPRSHFEGATFSHGGRIYVVGGRDDTSELLSQMELSDITVYDPGRDSWAHAPSLPVPLRSPVARVLDDKFYVTHGSTHWSEAPQDQLWVAPCDQSSGSPCATSGPRARIPAIKGAIRSLAKRHVGLLPDRLQRALFLSTIAER